MHYPLMQTTHHLHKTILAFQRRKISLSLPIKMAHKFYIGQKFEDFAAFERAIMRYQNAENVQFYRRDSRTVDKAQSRLEKKLNKKKISTSKLSTTVLTVGRNTFPRQQRLEKEGM